MRLLRRLASASALALGVLAGPALAGKADDTLRVTIRDALANIDPYYNGQGSGVMLQRHSWDTLVYRDTQTGELRPLLATGWTMVDDTTIDFDLRAGVTFHNGDAFSADDVVYTINTIIAPDSKVSNPGSFAHIASAEKLGDLKVRLHLKAPFPVALQFLASNTPIWPKAYREAMGPEDYARKPVGTGPYRIVSMDGVGEIVTERYDGYFADSPKGRPAINRVIFRAIADSTAQMAELLGGKSDWIEDVNPDQITQLGRMPNIATMRVPVNQTIYLTLNAAGRDRDDSPIKNVLVRRAIAHAIDRNAMAEQFQPGGSQVLNVICYENDFACDQSKATAYDYDPAKARALLAEAGYGNGVTVKLYNYLHPAWAAALQNYLREVGITAEINQMQISALFPMFQRGELPLNIGRWAAGDMGDPAYYMQYFFGNGALDQARDSDVTELVRTAAQTNDPAIRQEAYEQAFARISIQAYQLPLFTWVKGYAMSKDLDFKTSADAYPRFYLASWK